MANHRYTTALTTFHLVLVLVTLTFSFTAITSFAGRAAALWATATFAAELTVAVWWVTSRAVARYASGGRSSLDGFAASGLRWGCDRWHGVLGGFLVDVGRELTDLLVVVRACALQIRPRRWTVCGAVAGSSGIRSRCACRGFYRRRARGHRPRTSGGRTLEVHLASRPLAERTNRCPNV